MDTHQDAPPEFMEPFSKPFYRWDKSVQGPMPPEKSVEMCLKVIEELSEEQNGQFLSQYGNRVWLNEK